MSESQYIDIKKGRAVMTPVLLNWIPCTYFRNRKFPSGMRDLSLLFKRHIYPKGHRNPSGDLIAASSDRPAFSSVPPESWRVGRGLNWNRWDYDGGGKIV